MIAIFTETYSEALEKAIQGREGALAGRQHAELFAKLLKRAVRGLPQRSDQPEIEEYLNGESGAWDKIQHISKICKAFTLFYDVEREHHRVIVRLEARWFETRDMRDNEQWARLVIRFLGSEVTGYGWKSR